MVLALFALFSGICGLICLESDNESESGPGREKWKENETMGTDFDASRDSDWSSRFNESTSSLGMLMSNMYLLCLWLFYAEEIH